MSQSSTLTVVVPRILERLKRAERAESLLTSLAGRGDIARRWPAIETSHARLQPWQRGLLAALNLDDNNFPSAATNAVGERFDEGCRDWLHAEPIHLVAGLNEVALVSLPAEFHLTRDERDALTHVLAQHVAAEGFVLKASQDAWLMGSPRELEASTVTAAFAEKSDWNIVLPHGRDAAALRRLMTELQMLLHDHPVNEVRAARGVPIVNSLWLWGNGGVDSQHSAATLACVGDNAYLTGVCRLNEWPSPKPADSADVVLAAIDPAKSTVFVARDLTVDAFEGLWLEPFIEALKHNCFDRLELVLDEWLLTIDRWRLRRFWRRSLPLTAWAAA